MIIELKQAIHLLFSCYVCITLLIIKKLELHLLIALILFKIKVGDIQISVSDIGILM